MTHFNKISESGSSSFIFQIPAEGDLPVSFITGTLLPYQACEGSTLPTLPLGDAIYSQALWRSEGLKCSVPGPMQNCCSQQKPAPTDLQKANGLLYVKYLGRTVSLTIKHPRKHCTNKPTNAKFTQPTTVLKLIFTQYFPKSSCLLDS